MALTKAELLELDAQGQVKAGGGNSVKVQFNPETLKLSHRPSQSAASLAASDFVKSPLGELTVELWFDVTVASTESEQPNDVREHTKKVAFFMRPQQQGSGPANHLLPGVRFKWGYFVFDGIMTSLSESLEFFSSDGYPLRAKLSMTLKQIRSYVSDANGQATSPTGGPAAGTQPYTPAPANASVQSMADQAGKGAEWQDIAAQNNIENPRRPPTGTMMNMNAAA